MVKKIGLFFGTFNPVHNGHLMMANYIANNTEVEKILFVVSPDSPFKDTKNELLSFEERCWLIKTAIQDIEKLGVCDIESKLDYPTYTYNTIQHFIQNSNSDIEYKLIIGADNLYDLHKWYRIADILQMVKIIVIPRNNIDYISIVEELYREYSNIKGINVIEDCPYCTLSSTFIRGQIKDGKDISFYVPDSIKENIEFYYKNVKL